MGSWELRIGGGFPGGRETRFFCGVRETAGELLQKFPRTPSKLLSLGMAGGFERGFKAGILDSSLWSE